MNSFPGLRRRSSTRSGSPPRTPGRAGRISRRRSAAPLADAWDFLTRTPTTRTPTNYPLRDELAVVSRCGKTFERWQHKPTIKGTARIWFFVDDRTVYLEQVHTSHPNETK
ncbi:hypothetical protein ACLQ3K_09820 [Tsukamurella sp. DT100]|uniref:hypothetical protein n=1 Tax=Tsukamurella sp. DT100 TaxID=3393415 RepID=UPI003CE9B49A